MAFVTKSLDIGGSEQQMVALAERLPRDRFVPEFVLLTRRGPLADRAERAGSRVHVLDWADGRSIVRHQPDLLRLVRTIRRRRFDIVDAWLFHAYALTSLTRPVTRVPVLIAGRRSLSEYKEGFGRTDRTLDRLTRRRVDCIVANSEAVREATAAYEGIDRSRIRVIHNGIHPHVSIDQATRTALRAGWGFGDEHLVVGSVANYKGGKRLETLIRVVSRITAARPEIRLVLVGEGPRRPDLEALIEELGLGAVVRLHGAEPDARRILDAFDVVAQSSESEGLPNAMLEAAAAGLPIVATDAGGTREVLDGGAAGILVRVGDADALVDGLVRLAADPTLRTELGDRARVFVEAAFGMDRFVRETADLYEALADAKGVRR